MERLVNDEPSSLAHNELDSDFNEDDHEQFISEQPFKLKEEGNKKYVEGQYAEAIQLWMQGVKETLKRSVRYPSAALYQNQITCRLNMAMGYLKLGDWVEAKEQAQMVLEQRPTNVKALYRMATALEKLQDWSACEKVLAELLEQAKRADIMEEQGIAKLQLEQPKNEQSGEQCDSDDDPDGSRHRLDLSGFNSNELRRLVGEMKNRIAKDKAVYKLRAKKVFRGIGAKLDQIGASEDRPGAKDVSPFELPDDEGLDDVTLDKGMSDLVNIVDLHDIVRWRHQHPEDEEETKEILEKDDQRNTQHKETVKVAQTSNGTKSERKGLGASGSQHLEGLSPNESTESRPTMQQLLSTTATPILKNNTDCDVESDDPKCQLWSIAHSSQTLKEDRRPLTLSLPFTLLRVIELATAVRKVVRPEDGEVDHNPSVVSCLSESDLADQSKRGRLQRRLIRSLYRQRHLTIHVVGARGDSEMECQWTSILKRIPKLRTLQILFIGFQDADDRWSRGLREGVMSPPLSKSQGLSGGKKLTCRLFKGLYQLFQKEHPNVLTRRTHPFHPDLVMIPEPRLSRYFDPWISVLNDFVNHEIPTIFTGYSAVDHATHDAQNLPYVLKAMNAEWALPLQPNPFAVKVQPETDFPPMQLWVPAGEEVVMFHGISAKNAVFGVVFGYLSKPYSLNDTEMLKSQLRPICDIESEKLAIDLAANKLHIKDATDSTEIQEKHPTETEGTGSEIRKERRRVD